jgi:hypothetical protein
VNNLENETIVKIMVGFVIGPLILGAIIFSKLLSSVILLLIALGTLIESYDMTKSDIKYLIAGIPIISIPIASLFFHYVIYRRLKAYIYNICFNYLYYRYFCYVWW